METDKIIKHREKRVLHEAHIDVSDTFELSTQEFSKLSLTGKFSALWNKRYADLQMFKYSHWPGLGLYLFMSISGLLMMRNYIVPTMVVGINSIYWCKVTCFYLWYINTAHWLCVLLYESYWIPEEKEQLQLARKTLWDDYDQTLKSFQQPRILELETHVSSSKRRMFDYIADEVNGLKWRYCLICKYDSPPRSHHCVICNKCILKRDHHCFMTGRCIGYWNQRYFFFLCFFSALNSIICCVCEAYYLFNNSMENINNNWGTLFIPIAVYKSLWLNEISVHILIMISHLYIFPLLGSMSLAFVTLQSIMIIRGITSEEMKHGVKMKVNLGIIQRWQEVFGECWILNFVMPSQLLFRQSGDGESWPWLVNMDELVSLKKLRVIS